MRRIPVDAALCVKIRTRDGGQALKCCAPACRNSTATTSSTAMVLAVDETGTQLMMGSTTGGVWASSDAGDSWQTVSTTLPPVYAVKMGWDSLISCKTLTRI